MCEQYWLLAGAAARSNRGSEAGPPELPDRGSDAGALELLTALAAEGVLAVTEGALEATLVKAIRPRTTPIGMRSPVWARRCQLHG